MPSRREFIKAMLAVRAAVITKPVAPFIAGVDFAVPNSEKTVLVIMKARQMGMSEIYLETILPTIREYTFKHYVEGT